MERAGQLRTAVMVRPRCNSLERTDGRSAPVYLLELYVVKVFYLSNAEYNTVTMTIKSFRHGGMVCKKKDFNIFK